MGICLALFTLMDQWMNSLIINLIVKTQLGLAYLCLILAVMCFGMKE